MRTILYLPSLLLILLFSPLGTAALVAQDNSAMVIIPWDNGQGTFSTNVLLHVTNLGDYRILHLRPQGSNPRCRFKSVQDPVANGAEVTELNQTAYWRSYMITILSTEKQGTVKVSGKIEPDEGGGGAGPPPERPFIIRALQQWLYIYYSIPQNGTNLTVAVTSTNRVQSTVMLGNLRVPSGKVKWSVNPSTLGTFTSTEETLASGRAETKFISGSSVGTGTMQAEGLNLKDRNNQPLPNVTTNLTVNVLNVQMDHDLWWFNGEDPQGGYFITSTLTATPVTTGTFKWDVITGADKVNLNNGGADSDSITATDDNTVIVKSTAASKAAAAVRKDVRIRLTYNGVATKDFQLAVFAPHRQVHLNDVDSPNGGGYTSDISYELRDQFNRRLPFNVPWNEDIDGNGVQSNAATVSAAAISDWRGENWGWGAEGSGTVSPAAATDRIGRPGFPGAIPAAQNPQAPLGNQRVDHSPGGAWRVGSLTAGRGVVVANCVWQIYRDHGRHR